MGRYLIGRESTSKKNSKHWRLNCISNRVCVFIKWITYTRSQANRKWKIPLQFRRLCSRSFSPPSTPCVFEPEKRFLLSFMHTFKGRRHSFCFVVHLKLWVILILSTLLLHKRFFLLNILPVLFDTQPWPFTLIFLFHFVPFHTLIKWAIKVRRWNCCNSEDVCIFIAWPQTIRLVYQA